MTSKMIFKSDLKSKLDGVAADTRTAWQQLGIQSVDDLFTRMINITNSVNAKWAVGGIFFEDEIPGVSETSTYFGIIQAGNNNVLAYVFIIPPKYETRTGFLSQQVFPVYSDIIQTNLQSRSYELSGIPVFILNLNEANLTAAMAINVVSSKILGFAYADLYSRDIEEILKSSGLNPNITTLAQYDQLLRDNGRSSGADNRHFTIENKKITFLTSTLKDGIHVNNEPYWYVMKAYTALVLASRESYSIDMTTFEASISHGNKTLDPFYEYAMKLKRGVINVLQCIFYGAPGTGKSYKIDSLLKSQLVPDDYIFRVTFHPEYTYSDFIGQLLPTVDKEGKITYDFSKGVFTRALEKAYEDTSKDVYLILEEMSRGDCAAIFGDIFQLLDRERKGPQKGYSKYFINNAVLTKDISRITDDRVKLPPNLNIIGTVNTSDQNVFVMDTAFKRRFSWEYITTKPVPDEKPYENNVEFELTDATGAKSSIKWVDFYGILNKFITDSKWLGLGEDKQLGQFFLEFDENAASSDHKKIVQNKLLNYLWNDIHMASYKKNVRLFSDAITCFSDLYDFFENDVSVFSLDFFKCIELWKQNKL